MNNNILFFIASSQGEIDWVLPLIKDLNKKVDNIYFYVDSYSTETIINKPFIFNEIKNKFNLIVFNKSNFTRFSFLINIVRSLFVFFGCKNFIDKVINKILGIYINLYPKNFAKKIIRKTNPKILLKDLGNDSVLRKEISNIIVNGKGKIIMFPHGTEIFVEEEFKRRDFIADILLVSCKETQNYYSKVFRGLETKIVGIPRYDSNWTNYLKKNFAEKNDSKRVKFSILFITRGPHHSDLNKNDFEYIINSIATVCNKNKNIELLVRSHPRYPKSQLSNILNKHEKLDWKFCDYDIIIKNTNINLVVSMWSTMILDALVLKIPVIEFFRCSNNRSWLKNQFGNDVTGYEKNQIVISVKNEIELEQSINEIINQNLDKVNNTFNNFEILYDITQPSIESTINEIVK